MDTKVQHASTMRHAKLILSRTREAMRNQLCTGPRYPGKPQEYRYVVSEKCDHIERSRQARIDRMSRKSTGRNRNDPEPDIATNKAELKHVTRILRSQYGNLEPSGEHALHANESVMQTFGRMISPLLRRDYPDPEKRWEAIMAFYKRRVKGSKPLPRYRIFTMIKVHLQTMLLSY